MDSTVLMHRITTYMFSSWIEHREKAKCIRFKETVILLGSLLIGVLSICTFLKSNTLFFLDIAVLIITLLLYFSIQCAITKIEAIEKADTANLVWEINQLKKRNASLDKQVTYLGALCVETSVIAKAIPRVNNAKSAKQIYTKLASSIAEMTEKYSHITRDSFAVHIYVYDENTSSVQRVEVNTSIRTMQAADENQLQKINDVKKYYYAKCILAKKKTFVLPSNKEIRENFFFDDCDEMIIAQYTQYAAMKYCLPEKVYLYIEVISYHGKVLGDSLEDYLQKVIAPFSSLMSLVNWRKFKNDYNA